MPSRCCPQRVNLNEMLQLLELSLIPLHKRDKENKEYRMTVSKCNWGKLVIIQSNYCSGMFSLFTFLPIYYVAVYYDYNFRAETGGFFFQRSLLPSQYSPTHDSGHFFVHHVNKHDLWMYKVWISLVFIFVRLSSFWIDVSILKKCVASLEELVCGFTKNQAILQTFII